MQYNLVEIAGFVITFGSLIWKISQLRADIYKYIDSRAADIYEHIDTRISGNNFDIASISKNLAVHIAACEEKDESVDYKINALKEAINHKSNRLDTEIKKIESTLRTKGLI
jgi:hypothetical protein